MRPSTPLPSSGCAKQRILAAIHPSAPGGSPATAGPYMKGEGAGAASSTAQGIFWCVPPCVVIESFTSPAPRRRGLQRRRPPARTSSPRSVTPPHRGSRTVPAAVVEMPIRSALRISPSCSMIPNRGERSSGNIEIFGEFRVVKPYGYAARREATVVTGLQGGSMAASNMSSCSYVDMRSQKYWFSERQKRVGLVTPLPPSSRPALLRASPQGR